VYFVEVIKGIMEVREFGVIYDQYVVHIPEVYCNFVFVRYEWYVDVFEVFWKNSAKRPEVGAPTARTSSWIRISLLLEKKF